MYKHNVITCIFIVGYGVYFWVWFVITEIPELTSQPRLKVDFDKDTKVSTFECEFDKLDRGDVKYLIDWVIDDNTVLSVETTEDKSELTQEQYGAGGYGVKVRKSILH
jgi:hypothetical protein